MYDPVFSESPDFDQIKHRHMLKCDACSHRSTHSPTHSLPHFNMTRSNNLFFLPHEVAD